MSGHWSAAATQLPSAHRVGLSNGQVGVVGQVSNVTEQVPSGQRTGVEVGQVRCVRHSVVSRTQLPSAHSTGNADGHVTAVGHCHGLGLHVPSAHRTPDVHCNAASHAARSDRHAPFSHFTSPTLHVVADGQSVSLCLHSPLPHLTILNGQMNVSRHSLADGRQDPSGHTT